MVNDDWMEEETEFKVIVSYIKLIYVFLFITNQRKMRKNVMEMQRYTYTDASEKPT